MVTSVPVRAAWWFGEEKGWLSPVRATFGTYHGAGKKGGRACGHGGAPLLIAGNDGLPTPGCCQVAILKRETALRMFSAVLLISLTATADWPTVCTASSMAFWICAKAVEI